MSGPNEVDSIDVGSFVDRARELRREASTRASGHRVELYAKVGERVRLDRGRVPGQPCLSSAVETGVALRTLISLSEGAGFAASSGFSSGAVRWALECANTSGLRVSGLSPDTTETESTDRWDLDPDERFPTRPELLDEIARSPHVEWIEVGRTTEVLAGPSGWVTVRRRQRVWALLSAGNARLVARRGVGDWKKLMDLDESESPEAPASQPDGQFLTFRPEAASPIALALAGRFHSEDPQICVAGEGWTLEDDPNNKDGLAGGAFDDAGFRSGISSLAAGGSLNGRIVGPGTMWRRSFRDPPASSPSNLVMPAGSAGDVLSQGRTVDRSRVIGLEPQEWVVEMDLAPYGSLPRARAYARLSPAELLGRCSSRIGAARVTSIGPILPSLRFEGLPLSLTE